MYKNNKFIILNRVLINLNEKVFKTQEQPSKLSIYLYMTHFLRPNKLQTHFYKIWVHIHEKRQEFHERNNNISYKIPSLYISICIFKFTNAVPLNLTLSEIN